MIGEGLVLVEQALRHKRPGPCQRQAAIAAMHARAARPQDTDWAEIERLYAALERLLPTPVVRLNRAVAVDKLHGPGAALAMVEPLAGPLGGYFHFHGLRGALLVRLDRGADARAAFERAITLARTPAEAAHIRLQLDQAAADGPVRARLPDAGRRAAGGAPVELRLRGVRDPAGDLAGSGCAAGPDAAGRPVVARSSGGCWAVVGCISGMACRNPSRSIVVGVSGRRSRAAIFPKEIPCC
ncbi:MAG TPA: hypothetical protein VLJ62_10195 [Burkholderiaceae bacterium]|nr:hypothetical protein [Burkholderiaceae bacterium]